MIRIGKIVATHGLKGALVMTHVMDTSTWLKKGSTLLVEMQKGSHIPYFVTQCKAGGGNEYHINLEDINEVSTAKKLVTKTVYVNEDMLAAYAKSSPLLWIGFEVRDNEKGVIGIIHDIMQTPTQWLASIMHQNKEVLIPLIEQTIVKVDIKKRTLDVLLPDGLLNVYLL